ncbi:MAG TPA: nucleotidyltransferase family protein [Bryobacteraceae bacterium]|nr:nucleotidyltransferase family protein [Bryobacteraceae bacterium]
MIAILLAGGRSVRAGIDKATFELNGEMLVERHLRQLRAVGVTESMAVCNARNEAAIRARTGVRTVRQRGDCMSAAILTGIEEADSGAICAVCVNDIVGDRDYETIFAFPCPEESIVIPTMPLERNFPGGCLDLDVATGAVRRIVEKPEGGCPVGAAANIMIHRIRGRQLVGSLASLLRDGVEYEAAVNRLIRGGGRAIAVPIASWVAIKTADDIARAQAAAAQ